MHVRKMNRRSTIIEQVRKKIKMKQMKIVSFTL